MTETIVMMHRALLILAVVTLLILALIVRVGMKLIKAHGLEIIIIRLLIGRHHAHHASHRHTNATFWRDSNGKVSGRPTSRVTKRHHRAGWKNLLISLGFIAWFCGLAYGLLVARHLTVILACLSIVGGIAYKIIRWVISLRAFYRKRTTVTPLARALAPVAGVSEIDMEKAITLKPDYMKIKTGEIGRIYWPDTFHANEGEQTIVNNLVGGRLTVPVDPKWHTSKNPQYTAIMASPPLPTRVLFRDKLADIEACGPGKYVAGYDRFGKPYIVSHMGDRPHHAYSMNSGTGKSTRLGVYAAQLLGKDSTTEITGFDTKRVSLEYLRGIPGVIIYSDPKSMGDMWNGWYALKREMDRRYELYQSDPTAVETFPYHYVFLDEGNDFAVQIRGYYLNEVRDKGEAQLPPIWYEAIAPLLWQGREVRIFVIAVLQDFKEKFFGNLSLRGAFGTMGMAGFKPQQFRTINGISPSTAYQDGQGRVCIIEAGNETWIQGLNDDKHYLREYAMRHRKALVKVESDNRVNLAQFLSKEKKAS